MCAVITVNGNGMCAVITVNGNGMCAVPYFIRENVDYYRLRNDKYRN